MGRPLSRIRKVADEEGFPAWLLLSEKLQKLKNITKKDTESFLSETNGYLKGFCSSVEV